MGLRQKLLIPLFLIGSLMAGFVQFFWVPDSLRDAEAAHLRLIERHLDSVVEGLIPLMLSDQLANIHENLGALQKSNQEWFSVRLSNSEGAQLYPLAGKQLTAAGQGMFRRSIERPIQYLDMNMGRLEVLVDMATFVAENQAHHHKLLLMLLSMLLILTLTIILVLEFAVIRPARRLAAASSDLAKGEFESPLPEPSSDEIGALVHSFGAMRHELKAYHDELHVEIDERKAAQEQLNQHKEHLEELVRLRTLEVEHSRDLAESASRAKSAFLANMSHEIRTPMNAILGLTHLIRRDLVSPKQHERLDKVALAAKHLLGIINDILDFSKIEANKLTIEHADFEFDQVFRNLNNLIGSAAEEKKLEIVIRIDPEIPPYLCGDGMRVSQILANFASNAVKFTESGSIVLRARQVAHAEDGIRVRFEVSDTGIGLSEDQQERLFRAFEQADSSTTRRFGGTGLGLVICRRLAELMGGEVGVQSTLGLGSTFWCELPLKRAAKAVLDAALQPLPPALNVLVVDDDANAREALTYMLSELHARVTNASSGEAALECVRAALVNGLPFDLVLTDWAMPGMDGIETSRRIGTLGQPVPKIVLVTAYGRDWPLDRLREAGVMVQLNKPVMPSDLRDAMHAALFGDTPILAAAAEADEQGTAVDRSPLMGRYILLAEDNVVNQEVALELLHDVGLRVDLAEDGRQAVELVRRNEYDLILMDVQMPKLDGIAATREIRLLPQRTAVPILAMTANAYDEDRDACLGAGMNDHIAKPVDPERLYSAMLHWMQKRPGKPMPVLEKTGEPAADSAAQAGGTDFSGVEGLDVEAGLRVVARSWNAYRRVLRLFAAHHREDARRIRNALDAGQFEEVRSLAHALKGSAGNIGAGAIQALSAAIELPFKKHLPDAPAVVSKSLEELAGSLPHFIDQLESALGADETAPMTAAPVDAPMVAALVEELRRLAADDDIGAQQFFREHRAVLQSRLGIEKCKAIGLCLDRFDFVAALAEMDECLLGLPD